MKKLTEYLIGTLVLVLTMIFIGLVIGILAGSVASGAYLTFKVLT
jgi:ABC-type phosphate transport system permease subunit